MDNIAKGIWGRRGEDQISRPLFYALSLFWVFVGLWITHSVGMATKSFFVDTSWWIVVPVILIAAAAAVAGMHISASNSNWETSAAGLGILAVSFGVMVAPALASYGEPEIISAVTTALQVAMVMGVAGLFFPGSLRLLGGLLGLALFGLIGLLIISFFVHIEALEQFITWLGITIFSLYVARDVNRLKEIPATYNNAVDGSIAIYADIVNLAIYSLRRD